MAGFFAGIAQGMASTGICHAIAHYVGPRLGLSHSRAVALFLRETVKYSLERSAVIGVCEGLGWPPKRLTALLNKISETTTYQHAVPAAPFSLIEAAAAIRRDPCALTHPFRVPEEDIIRLIEAGLRTV
jgi:alcohol dehydrogenase class IV